MKNINRIFSIIVVVILLGLGIYGGITIYKLRKDLKASELEFRTSKIRGDSLKKISDVQFRKLVADTLTQKQLNKLIESLSLEIDGKNKMIQKLSVRPKPVVNKPIDKVVVTEDSVKINSFYPNKSDWFVNYQSTVFIKDGVGEESWNFQPLSLSVVLSQRKDGIWSADLNAPSWITVEGMDIQAIPLEPPVIDNFALIAGASYGKDFEYELDFFRVTTGFRYKKVYILLGATTNKTVDVGALLEL